MVEKRDFNMSLYYADGIEIEETGAGIEITAGSIKKETRHIPWRLFRSICSRTIQQK
ncbi:hypothetical protein [Bacillus velezensis]|uniref:hypothetical protein n=1 Tax=Bacillus velezensis TaxID=492670 RepID=UPI002174F8B9|nr:hypothetical protein [Bacillus velezensis]